MAKTHTAGGIPADRHGPENVVTVHREDDGGFTIWGDGPAWPNDPANPRVHGAVWPGYGPERGRVVVSDAAGIAEACAGRLVMDLDAAPGGGVVS